jgi:hypothetical protein
MPGFASVDQVLNATTVELRGQVLSFSKRLQIATTLPFPFSMWGGIGNPSVGVNPSTGLGGAAVCTSATAGALKFTNPSGGRTMHLLSWSLNTTQGNCTLMLVDRLAHANINNNQGTGNFSPVIDGTSRLASGEGAQLFMEVTATLSAAANSRTFTYTNQDGDDGRVTPTITTSASAVFGRFPYADYLWVPLQAGDTGVRSIESTTLISGSATGVINVVLCRPISPPIMTIIQSALTDRDYVTEIPSLPLIRSDSCLQFVGVAVSTTAYVTNGEIRIAEN